MLPSRPRRPIIPHPAETADFRDPAETAGLYSRGLRPRAPSQFSRNSRWAAGINRLEARMIRPRRGT
jgi:hypothetical protein